MTCISLSPDVASVQKNESSSKTERNSDGASNPLKIMPTRIPSFGHRILQRVRGKYRLGDNAICAFCLIRIA